MNQTAVTYSSVMLLQAYGVEEMRARTWGIAAGDLRLTAFLADGAIIDGQFSGLLV